MNTYNTAMKLLGKIAEAVIVRRCNEDEEINRKWFSLARRKNAQTNTAKRFQALGTGFVKTKNIYPQRYNPPDPQRDIIWVDIDNKTVANMNGSTSMSELEAGLQVKTSNNGCNYILNDLCNIRYEVPVVYFDISYDFDVVAIKLMEYRQRRNEQQVCINQDLICARAIDFNAFQEVCYYSWLVVALLDGKLRPEDLINEAEKDPSMMNAVLATGLESIRIGTEIYH